MREPLSRLADAGISNLVHNSDLRCGIDVVDLSQFRRDIQVGGERFLGRIFTESELAHSLGRVERLAARFAAKEAVAKALGTGIRGIAWKEIEVVSSRSGEPHVRLRGRAKDRAAALGIQGWGLSLTHTESVALAMVIAKSVNRVAESLDEGGESIG